MKTTNIYTLVIISFICIFFLGCSSTQLMDISKEDQLKDLLTSVGDIELDINTNEEVKKLVIKSIVGLDSEIKINFVDKVNNETLVIKNNFLDQEFVYFCKSANDYLDEAIKDHLFDSENSDEIFIFYSERYKSRAQYLKNRYSNVKTFVLNDDYDDLIKNVFELSGSYFRSDLINRLVQKEDINFVPRPRDDFEKIYIIADFDQTKNFVPSLRFNYILDKEIYVSSESIMGIENRKKLLDFSNVILSVPNAFIEGEEIANLNELSNTSFLQDLIIISAIEKIGKNSLVFAGSFANVRFSQSSCSDMNLNLVQIDNQGEFKEL